MENKSTIESNCLDIELVFEKAALILQTALSIYLINMLINTI